MITAKLVDVMGNDLEVVKCTLCRKDRKFPEEFYKKSEGRIGYTTHCRDCHKKMSRKYRDSRYKENPFKQKHYNLKSSANSQSVSYNLTPEYLGSIWTGKCAIFKTDIVLFCNRRLAKTSAEVDKIDAKKGYTVGNVQWVCHRANRLKDNATIEELEMVLDNMRQHAVQS